MLFSSSAMPSNASLLKKFVALRQFLFQIEALMPLRSQSAFNRRIGLNNLKVALRDVLSPLKLFPVIPDYAMQNQGLTHR
jgi:hypothetical protein